jgi:predicted TIM-barrel fold metal-dependent hydrolase
VKAIGPDKIVFGSDYPHPEGLADPLDYVDDLAGLAEDDIAKIMGGNLARLMKVDVKV